MEATLVWSPAWRAVRHGGDVVLSGGGDALFVLDQLPVGAAEAIEAAQAAGTVAPGHGGLAPFVDRLLALGAVAPVVPDALSSALVIPLGAADQRAASNLAEALAAWRPTHPTDAPGAADPGVTVIVRSATEVAAVPAPLPLPSGTALLVDLGHQHTVSIGPWWAGPASSCPACYFGRLRHRWGDLPLPAAPDVGRWSDAVAALVAVQLEEIDAGRSRLINAAISWDLRDGRCQRDAVLKVPWCETCGSVR